MKKRQTKIDRKSTETQIRGTLDLDGKGQSKIKTPVGLLTHMLELFAFHGIFDLTLEVKGDTHIDIHHTNEDIGIALGKAFKTALGDKNGIHRFGTAFAPMESTVGQTVVDISGRGYATVSFGANVPAQNEVDGYSRTSFEHFLESFAHTLGATIVVKVENPSADLHTNVETIFKSLGMALRQAVAIDPRRKGKIPSTKGIID